MVLIASEALAGIAKKPPHIEKYALKQGSEELGRWQSWEDLKAFQETLPRKQQILCRVVLVYELSPKRSRRSEAEESAVSDWLPSSKICLGV